MASELEEILHRYLPNHDASHLECLRLGAAVMLRALGSISEKNTTTAPVTFQASLYSQEIEEAGVWEKLNGVLRNWA